jgi:hypothetical protein
LPFEPDSDTKQRAASDLVRLEAERWLRPLYDELEALRLGQ